MTLPLYLQITVGVIVGVGSYFIGNINTAVALSKLKGKDIRKCGSGNPGTMNMIRTFGKPFGALTLLLDVAKGVLPSLLGWLFMGNGEFLRLGADRLGLYVGGLCAEIGHIYPVAMKFKGGKGVATLLGVCLTCKPVIWIASMAVGIAFLFVAKIGSLTSFIMMCAPLAVEGVVMSTAPLGAWYSALIFSMFALTLFAHRKNLVKLFSGNERLVVLKKSKRLIVIVDRSILFDGTLIAE